MRKIYYSKMINRMKEGTKTRKLYKKERMKRGRRWGGWKGKKNVRERGRKLGKGRGGREGERKEGEIEGANRQGRKGGREGGRKEGKNEKGGGGREEGIREGSGRVNCNIGEISADSTLPDKTCGR